MCPACLASIGMLVAAAASSAGAATALVAAKIRSKKPDVTTQPNGDSHAATEDRIQG
jgi:hypothetical protein